MNAAATIALPEGDPLIKPFAEDLWNMEVPTGTWRYYDGLLYMLGLLACSGKFAV
jgi:oligosaccharide reducing-end xylanase